ncbi:aminotransferase class V-fold PLP-dependent enzyme [Xanthovirga aplysinae]|uniref:aminotransferase class V-fold PLP-dependent enzyme n=1 Tax=Xanthovirga aplysinae TaxID=2529853 RepID=UPI0012BD0C1F|nr:aminotransferase class V-fold PLP-dependent enzyme [Xanthovirga aplysinae]MTI29609.1 alanine--glyoxylate aminotransferase family protein [Xanthovirga aplysinae]
MKNQIYFTPGPSALYFTVREHLKSALDSNVASISHRSSFFKSFYGETVENLRTLLKLPDNFQIFFTGSATEIWERIIENCVDKESFHLVNGAFSERFYKTAVAFGKEAHKVESIAGSCPEIDNLMIAETHELIGITHNETSTGATQPLEDIYKIREAFPDQLIAVDAVSSLPYVNIDYSKVDTVYFSVQKCFGLPPGLGVWLVNDRCIEKAENRMRRGKNIGYYHSLPTLYEKGLKNQTPETPNSMGIYLLGKVVEDMLKKGIDQIRKETNSKAAILYNSLNKSDVFKPFVEEKRHQSKTVIVGKTAVSSADIIQDLKKKGMTIGGGYGEFKDLHIRIANFPTHSKEQIEMLADALEKI